MIQFDFSNRFHFFVTLPKTNIAPENRPLEKEIPIGNHHFQVLCYFQGGYEHEIYTDGPCVSA